MNIEPTQLSCTQQTVIPAGPGFQVLQAFLQKNQAPDFAKYDRIEAYEILAWLMVVNDLGEDSSDNEPSVTAHPITAHGVPLEPYGIRDPAGRIQGAHQFERFKDWPDLLDAINEKYQPPFEQSEGTP